MTLHVFDVHCPYTPSGAYANLFRAEGSVPMDLEGKCGNPHLNRMDLSPGQVSFIVDQYDGGIAYVDARLGVFLTALREMGLREETVLMVTSDHGEEFREHGQIGHERTVYDEVLRVPWILVARGVRPGRIAQTVRLIDLAPTALELLGLPVPAGLQGRSLVPLLRGGRDGEVPAFSELDRHVRMRSLQMGVHHLIRTGPEPEFRLYDLGRDPGEREDLWTRVRGSRVGKALVRELEGVERRAESEGARFRRGNLDGLDPDRRRELEEQLRSLGYLP